MIAGSGVWRKEAQEKKYQSSDKKRDGGISREAGRSPQVSLSLEGPLRGEAVTVVGAPEPMCPG